MADGARRPTPPAPAVGGPRRRVVLARAARKVAQATRELTVDRRPGSTSRWSGTPTGRLPFSPIHEPARGQVVAADPRGRRGPGAQGPGRGVREGRAANDHGQAPSTSAHGAAQMARIDATIAFYADVLATLGDTDPRSTSGAARRSSCWRTPPRPSRCSRPWLPGDAGTALRAATTMPVETALNQAPRECRARRRRRHERNWH